MKTLRAQGAEYLGAARWALRYAKARLPRLERDEPEVIFRCNICGRPSRCGYFQLDREHPSCRWCDSNVRWRSVISVLSHELFGRSLTLADFPRRKDLRGLGLSDERVYAKRLARKLDYRNTFYDAEPQLNIVAVDRKLYGQHDFILATDVFEHVAPPVGLAFENARRLLRPGGKLIFSVPYKLDGDTEEHFPDLHEFAVTRSAAGHVLKNRTRDGREQRFTELVFHDGRGLTLEMRLFSLGGIERCVRDAGFEDLRICGEDDPAFGILWRGVRWSLVMVATA